MHIPGMKVIMPSTPRDGKGPADLGDLRRGPLPVHRDHPPAGPEGAGANRSRLLDPARPGRHQAARHRRHASSATGAACIDALAAAEQLAATHGVSAEVVDLRTLVPLDVETIVESVGRTRRAVVVHDAVQFAGPGAEVAAILQAELFGGWRRRSSGSARGSSRHPARRRAGGAALPVAGADRRGGAADACTTARAPMADFIIRIPRVSVAVSEAELIDLLVDAGEHVEEGTPDLRHRDREGGTGDRGRRVGHRAVDRPGRHDV